MKEEFGLCIKAGVRPLPVGATGFMAAELWQTVLKDFDKYYPSASTAFRQSFELIGDPSKSPTELQALIQKLIDELQRA